MSRRGKIARLPERIRQRINARLQNGEEGRKIISWLNSLREVKRILAVNFGGRELTDGNLHEWRHGGFMDWQMERVSQTEAKRMLAEARNSVDSDGPLVGSIAVLLLSRCMAVTQSLLRDSVDPQVTKRMRELSGVLAVMRRSELREVRLRLHERDIALKQRRLRLRERIDR